jgi:hypothetical protein
MTEGLCECKSEVSKVSTLAPYISKVQSFLLLFQSNEIHFHTHPNWQSPNLKTDPRRLMREVFLADLVHLVKILQINKMDLASFQFCYAPSNFTPVAKCGELSRHVVHFLQTMARSFWDGTSVLTHLLRLLSHCPNRELSYIVCRNLSRHP